MILSCSNRPFAVRAGNSFRPVPLLAPIVLLAMSHTTPALAYRTATDSTAFAGVGRVAWTEPSVPFYLSSADLPAGLDPAVFETSLAQSFEAWSQPECAMVRPFFAGWVADLPSTRDGQNTIAWVSDWSARQFPSSAPGNTDLQYHGSDKHWEIGEADVYLTRVSPLCGLVPRQSLGVC